MKVRIGPPVTAKRHLAAVEVRAVDAGIGQLDAGKRAVGFHRLGHAGEGGDVLVLPQVLFDEGGDFGGGVDLGLFGEDHAPAALGLGAAHFDHGGGVAVAAAVAMRDLVEAVLRGLGADLQRRRTGCRGGGRASTGSAGRRLGWTGARDRGRGCRRPEGRAYPRPGQGFRHAGRR